MQESVPELKNYPQQSSAADALLDGANAAQREAIAHYRGPMLVLAGPGSGKTFTMIRRIQYLIQIYGVSPSAILVITFTKAAATEMQSRFCQTDTEKAGQPQFGTFHSIFFSIIQKHCHYKISDLVTPAQQRMFIKQILLNGTYGLPIDLDTMENLLSFISRYKNLGEEQTGEGLLTQEQFKKLYLQYQEQMEWHHKIDFDDMLLLCREVLQKQKEVRELWQKRFSFILVDEFQDINPLQYEILQMLAGKENNLFVVGDDDQAIYGFRGSKPEILLQFPKEYPDAIQVQLSCNYRSGNAIVESAQQVIRVNQVRFPKELKANRTGGKVKLVTFETPKEEQEKILQYLKHVVARKEQCAVLCRTNRELLEWAKECEKRGIAYQHKIREKSPWEESCGKDLLAYLRLGLGNGSREDLLRILNKPMRYLSRESVGAERIDFVSMLQFYEGKREMQKRCRQLEQDLNKVGKMPAFLAVSDICRRVGYERWMLEQCHDEKSRATLLQQLEACKKAAMQCKTVAELLALAEKEGKDNSSGGEMKVVDSPLSLMTYHASKGLEFTTVFLPGLNEGKVPHGKNLTPKEMEEERRMFYVAMTRAKENLYLTYLQSETQITSRISPFLKPLIEYL